MTDTSKEVKDPRVAKPAGKPAGKPSVKPVSSKSSATDSMTSSQTGLTPPQPKTFFGKVIRCLELTGYVGIVLIALLFVINLLVPQSVGTGTPVDSNETTTVSPVKPAE